MATGNKQASLVVKVGGSLFDMPNLGPKLQAWLPTLPDPHVLLVPGGGATADVVRELDGCHALGEERAHWLALAALSLNARFLQTLLPAAQIIDNCAACEASWSRGHLPILDAYPFAIQDEQSLDALPHAWSVTSDSVAARVAQVCGARQLILLKSVAFSGDWDEASSQGYVDAFFARAMGSLSVCAIDFRSWQPR
jgi:5-(aminomethyl)-3-furanmethanol phosphate kinase